MEDNYYDRLSYFFFFSIRRRHTRCGRDWSSDVCSSDLGRAPAGERVPGPVPGHWESVTMIAGLRLSGVVAPWVFEGATDNPAFETYVTEVLAPELRPGDVVVWDNLRPHQQAVVVQAVEAVGATVKRLPPHSPDLTPIEKLWSKAKEKLRALAARTVR